MTELELFYWRALRQLAFAHWLMARDARAQSDIFGTYAEHAAASALYYRRAREFIACESENRLSDAQLIEAATETVRKARMKRQVNAAAIREYTAKLRRKQEARAPGR